MRHREFAERAARRLEALAGSLEEEGCGTAADGKESVRAREMRTAALMVLDEADAVTRSEASRLIVSTAKQRLGAWARTREE